MLASRLVRPAFASRVTSFRDLHLSSVLFRWNLEDSFHRSSSHRVRPFRFLTPLSVTREVIFSEMFCLLSHISNNIVHFTIHHGRVFSRRTD
jgi:hypothetical protein